MSGTQRSGSPKGRSYQLWTTVSAKPVVGKLVVPIRALLWPVRRACKWGGGGDDPRSNQHNPQYANYWAPLTRKQYHMDRRPQRPSESVDPTQHAKGKTGDCPGPRKETATRRNAKGGGGRDALEGGEVRPSPAPGRPAYAQPLSP